jgi:hypothetical protein
VQVARAVEQPVKRALVGQLGLAAVAQGVVAVLECFGVGTGLGLGLAEKLAYGVVGKGDGGGGVGGAGELAQ